MNHNVLIEIEDRKGLIHDITGVFSRQGWNIITNNEFVDLNAKRFFMRSEIKGDGPADLLERELQQLLPTATRLNVYQQRKKDIVILATKEAHCLGDLLLRNYEGKLNANIKAVFANHEDLRPLVEKFEIPFTAIPHKNKAREAHETLVLNLVEPYKPEYLVLAKYMLILTPQFVQAYPNRIINIHHSFLPAFIGANPYRQAWERGVKIIGATSHFVNDGLDDGPIIAQKITQVDHTHGWREMAEAGREAEKAALAEALKWVFEDRVFVMGNRTVILD